MLRKILFATLIGIILAALMPTAVAAVPRDGSVDSPAATTQVAAAAACVGGMADIYPCKNIDLQSNLPLASMGGGSGSGGWG